MLENHIPAYMHNVYLNNVAACSDCHGHQVADSFWLVGKKSPV